MWQQDREETIKYQNNSSFFSEDTGHNKDYVSLGGKNSTNIEQMLAHLGSTEVGPSDYFSLGGKRTSDMSNLRKPKNVTPSMPRPYCRYKAFLRMP